MSFFSYEFEDQAIHHQLVWNTAQGNWFKHSIGTDGSFFFYFHFQPIILLQSIVYKAAPHIYTFFFTITAALGLGGLFIFLISELVLKNSKVAFLLTLVYLVYTPLHNLVFVDGDPIIFSIPLILALFYALEKNSYFFNKHTVFCSLTLAILTLMCKEDLSFLLICLGLYFFATRRRKWGAVMSSLGLVWLGLSLPIMLWLVSLGSKESIFNSLGYGSLQDLVIAFAANPTDALNIIFSQHHLDYFGKLFFPLAFLPFGSGVLIVGLPTFMEILLGRREMMFNQAYYISPLIPLIFMGLIYTFRKIQSFCLSRIPTKTNSVLYLLLSIILVLNVRGLFVPNILGHARKDKIVYDDRFVAVKNIFNPVFYTMDMNDKAAWKLISLIPPTASVAASGDLLVALSGREVIKELFSPHYGLSDVNYVLLNTKYMGFGASDYYFLHGEQLDNWLVALEQSNEWEAIDSYKALKLFKRRER